MDGYSSHLPPEWPVDSVADAVAGCFASARIEVTPDGRIESASQAADDLLCPDGRTLPGGSAQTVFDTAGIPFFPVSLIRRDHPTKVSVFLSTGDGRSVPVQISISRTGVGPSERVVYAISRLSADRPTEKVAGPVS